MGGSVRVESEVGKGSSFIINLKTKCIVSKPEFSSNKDLKQSGSGCWGFISTKGSSLESCINHKVADFDSLH